MRKNKKIDYLIMALACLVILNIGALAITVSRNFNLPFNINKEGYNIVETFTDYGEKAFQSLRSLAEAINLFNKEKEVVVSSKEVLKEDNHQHEEDVEKEIHSEDDVIIKRLDEYENLIIIKDSQGGVNIENIPEPIGVKKIAVNKEEPYIFIYHTHATESFAHFRKDNYRSSSRDDNVVGIGDIFSTILKANGHSVNHNDVYHDLPSYNKSYSRSSTTVKTEKEKSPDLKFFLDIHRDGIEEDSPSVERIRKESRTVVNERNVTTFSLVVGPDSPNKEEVLNFAKYIKAVSDSMYPGLCTKIIIKPIGRYNQHMSDYSALIEMGYNINDLEEVKESAKLVGEVLSYAFDGLIIE